MENLKEEIKTIILNAEFDIEDIEVEDVNDIESFNIKNDDFKVIQQGEWINGFDSITKNKITL